MTDRFQREREVADRGLDLHKRIGALGELVDEATDGATLTAVARQIDDELSGDDTRFVIYLIGALRRIYDRAAIDIFIDLLKRPIDLSFRSQSVIGLRELYRHSVRRWLLARPRAEAAQPAVAQHLGMVDENFVVHGADLTADDRRRISKTLQSIADDPNETSYLRDEARESYAMCHALSTLISE